MTACATCCTTGSTPAQPVHKGGDVRNGALVRGTGDREGGEDHNQDHHGQGETCPQRSQP